VVNTGVRIGPDDEEVPPVLTPDRWPCAPEHRAVAAIVGSVQSMVAPFCDCAPCNKMSLVDCEKHVPAQKKINGNNQSGFRMKNPGIVYAASPRPDISFYQQPAKSMVHPDSFGLHSRFRPRMHRQALTNNREEG
jgi:hypothetical protein